MTSEMSSVFRDDRAAPAVVHANGDHVDILTDALVREQRAGERTASSTGDERVIAAAHEQVVVFEADRPVRREAEFGAGADDTTPAGIRNDVGDGRVGPEQQGA